MRFVDEHGELFAFEQLRFENRYQPVRPEPLESAHLISFSPSASSLIGLHPEQLERKDFVDILLGGKPVEGLSPVAMCYSGHQFGQYVPRLGDGRAALLGQVRTREGKLFDLHLKGSGPTEYSRGGDGRAVMRSSIREYLMSEAMHGLGIPTTRALCLIGSQSPVRRERIEKGAMLLRLAESHVRFGSFEYFYHTGQHQHLRHLADYVIHEFYPDLVLRADKYMALFVEVMLRTARLIAQWQAVGFVHGVLNSDNMSVLGLTLDYGPYAFLDTYEAAHVSNHSDHIGRYAFNEQPNIGLFNLSCLAQALVPLVSEDENEAIEMFKEQLANYWPLYKREELLCVRAKLGLKRASIRDLDLWRDLLPLMEGNVDYTRFFRALANFDSQHKENNGFLRDMFVDREGFDVWAERYSTRLEAEGSYSVVRKRDMNKVNPKYILRSYMAEKAIRLAEDERDYSEIERLKLLLEHPFDEQPEMEAYAAEPPDWARSISLSCSS